jgi:hypothetical protein
VSLSGVVRSYQAPRIAGIVLVLVALLSLGGCGVVSVNSLYEDVSPKDPDIVLEKGLPGSWTITDDKCVTVVYVTLKDDVYDLQSLKEGKGCADAGEKIQEQAQLVKLDNYYFLDVSPRPHDVCGTCLALHQILLVTFGKDTMSLTPIDDDGLRAAFAAKSVTLSTLPEDPKGLIHGRPMTLTGLSKELKDFCRKFASDKTIFKPESADVFKRM